MFTNRQKAELIFEISGSRAESVCRNILSLLDILIDEVRIENDTAAPDTFMQNQGKIKAYTALKDYILRGLPTGNAQA